MGVAATAGRRGSASGGRSARREVAGGAARAPPTRWRRLTIGVRVERVNSPALEKMMASLAVEKEICSLVELFPSYSVCSTGGVPPISSKISLSHLTLLISYNNLYVTTIRDFSCEVLKYI
jgi:hypothetical protein